MTQEEMRKEYYALYHTMENSSNVDFMRIFGQVQTEVMEWAIANKPDLAQEWIEKLSAIKWKNYVTQKEAESIVSKMNPKAPWNREQWKDAMEKAGYPLEDDPCYNSCALYVTMNMKMSDSSETLTELVGTENLFKAVYLLALDNLTDKDGKFKIREYFDL